MGMQKIFDGLIFFFFCILFFGVSLFFTGLTLQGVIFDRYLFFLVSSLLITSVWLAKGLYEGKLLVRRTPLDIPFLIFWGVYGISMLFSEDVWHSFTGGFLDPSRGFIVVTASFLLYTVLLSTQTQKALSVLSGVFVLGLGVVTLWSTGVVTGIFQKVSGRIPDFLTSIPMDDFLALNILISVAFPVTLGGLLYLVSAKVSLWVKILGAMVGMGALLMQIYLLSALYLAVTIGALFFGLGIFVSYIFGDIIFVSKKWKGFPVVIFLAVFPVLYLLGPSILAKKGMELDQSVFSGMKISWETTINVLGERFFSGTGPATYGYAFSHFFPTDLNATDSFAKRLVYPQNYFFEMMATGGILTGLAFLGLWILTLSIAFFLLTQRRKTNSVLSLGLWVSVLVLSIAGFFLNISGSVIFPGVLVSLLAVAILIAESGAQAEYRTISLRAMPQYALASTGSLFLLCVGMLTLFVLLGKMYIADVYASRAFAVQAQDAKRGIENIDKAIRFNGKEGQYSVFRGQMYFTLVNKALGSSDSNEGEKSKEETRQIQEWIGETIRSLKNGRDQLPGSAFAQESLAQTVESLGSMEDAFNAYKEAEKIEPKNPAYPVRMAQIRIAQAEKLENKEVLYAEAERYIGDALALKGDYSEAWYQKALIFEGRKDLDQALDFSQEGLKSGRDIRSALQVARLYQVRGKEGDDKNAEDILKSILDFSAKEINAQLMLAGLYEKMNRKEESIALYESARDLLPEASQKLRDQINALINKLKNGETVKQTEMSAPTPNQNGGGVSNSSPVTSTPDQIPGGSPSETQTASPTPSPTPTPETSNPPAGKEESGNFTLPAEKAN